MARKRVNLTDLLNDLTFRTIYNKYKMVAMNEWAWGGLCDGIEQRHIEKPLFHDGMVCVFKDPLRGFMCLPCEGVDQNVAYGDPLTYRVQGLNYNRLVDAKDCVIIENNLLRLATEPFVLHYVNKLTEAERTMDVNLKACKTPIVFACDDKDVLTFKRIFQQVDGNTPAVFADKGLNLDNVKAFLTGVTFMGNDLMDFKRSVESDLLTFLGQNNTPVDKKERLITDEAEANDQLIQSFADLQGEARQRACDAINAKWGDELPQPWTVERRGTVQNSVDSVEKDGVDDVV